MSSKKLSSLTLCDVRKFSNLKNLLTQTVAQFGQRTAFVYQNQLGGACQKITYEEFEKEVATTGGALLDLLKIDVLEKTDKKIALLAPNSYDWSLAYLATVNWQLIIVPIDYQLPVADLINLLKTANVQAIIFDPIIDQKIAEIKKTTGLKINHYVSLGKSDLATVTWQKIKENGLAQKEKFWELYQTKKIYPDTLSTLIFTSGTTSTPKAVMLSHRTFCVSVRGMAQLLGLQAQTYLSVLPLFHIYEFECGLLLQILRGSTIYYLAGGMHCLTQNLQIAKPTELFLVPLVVEGAYKRIVSLAKNKNDLQELKEAAQKYFGGRLNHFYSAGAALSAQMAKKFALLDIPCWQGYGISENSACIAFNCREAQKISSVGLPIPSTKITIERTDENGVGEIMLRGPSVMLGYYKQERQTDVAIDNGWLRTGDYGYCDQDGFLYITGRKKNVIIGKNAKNVYPEELEFLLNKQEGIAESLVYGEVVGDDVQVAALIVPQANLNLSAEKLKTLMQQKIELINSSNVAYKEIKKWRLVAGLPKNTVGKIKRNQNVV